jgi:hypothetical protein
MTNFEIFVGELTKTTRVCKANPEKTPKKDIGYCIGTALASCGYLAAVGIELEFARYACDGSLPHPSGTPYDPNAVECTLRVSTGVNSLTAGGSLISQAVENCGGIETSCATGITKAITAVSEAANSFANVVQLCPMANGEYFKADPVRAREWARWVGGFIGSAAAISMDQLTINVQKLCSASITGSVKALSVVASEATEASDTCRNLDLASTSCGSSTAQALASIAFFASQASEASLNCDPNNGVLEGFTSPTYKCGVNFQRMGYIADTLSVAIGHAAADCDLPPDHSELQRPEKLHRRFFVPAR